MEDKTSQENQQSGEIIAKKRRGSGDLQTRDAPNGHNPSESTDVNSKDPLPDLTKDQRVVLYTLLLHDYVADFNSIDGKVFMGNIDVSETVVELENRGLLQSDRGSNKVYISSKKRYQIMRSYRNNCLLSDIDKDFFMEVASGNTIYLYVEVYILNHDCSKRKEDTAPISLMRLIVQYKPVPRSSVLYAIENNIEILPPACGKEGISKKLEKFVQVWNQQKKILDPIAWADNCPNERIKSIYNAGMLCSLVNTVSDIEDPCRSPFKSSILCTILMADNYKIPKDSLKEKNTKLLKVFPPLSHNELDNFLETIEEMERFDKSLIVEKETKIIRFSSENTRHQVMGYFVLKCLQTYEDYKNYIKISSLDSLLEYVRPWQYLANKIERCLYLPKNMEDTLIKRLGFDAIRHVMVARGASRTNDIREKVVSILNLPEEILDWDRDALCRYIECAKKGTQTIHRARAMIVGCAGAGKTTLLKRLQKKNLAELRNVRSTIGLEVYEDIFEILQDQDTLKVSIGHSTREGKDLLSITDFAGQCAYYACHQVFLSRRAFYLLVVDMSKPFNLKVDPLLCDQEGTMFNDWTYGEYLLFWMKSIHTYCDQEDPVILVGTHLDKVPNQTADELYNSTLDILQDNKSLKAHLNRERCFILGLQNETTNSNNSLSKLERCIVSVAKENRWKETIPTDWALCEIVLREIKRKNALNEEKAIRIMEVNNFAKKCFGSNEEKTSQIRDVLKLFHDIGILLHISEKQLSDIVIIDIQWFVDSFKNIITDPNQVRDIARNRTQWRDFNQNGNLPGILLTSIWRSKKFEIDPHLEKYLLNYMQRLGLIAVGSETHYIPSVNKRTFDAAAEFSRCQSKTSVLVYRFEFLPYFFYYRLIVACLTGEWKILEDNGLCLFKDIACFSYKQHSVALAVNKYSIQLQVFKPSNDPLTKEVTLEVHDTIDRLLNNLTKTFHRKIMFTVGFQCSKQEVFSDLDECFVDEIELKGKGSITCPRHQMKNHHILRESDLLGYWKPDVKIEKPGSISTGDQFSKLYEEGLKKFHFKTFEKITRVGREALQIYFDTIFSKQKLIKIQMSANPDKVKKMYHLSDDQYSRLCPADKSDPLSFSFDVTMMYQMLRNRKHSLQSPTKGWGKTPDVNDFNESDDVERIRIYRNQVVHEPDATRKLDKMDLEKKGRDLAQAILRLSNGTLQSEIIKVMEHRK